MISLLRLLRGYVKFSIYGVYPQRFINNALRAGVWIWDVSPIKYGFKAKMYAKDYKKIHGLAKGCYLRTKVDERKGLPFLLHNNKKRWGIFAGLVLVLVLFLGLSQMVWLVEVYGGESIDHEEIKRHLDDIGLGAGTLRSSINVGDLERELMAREQRIGWVAINVKGGRVEVEIHQRDMPPEAVDVSGKASNVIATDTAYITMMDVYEGQPVVKIGDGVIKGDIIVSGVTLDKFGNTQLKQARGNIRGQVRSRLEVEIPLNNTATEQVGDGVSYKYLVLWGFKIPIAGSIRTFDDYITSVETKPLLFGGKISYENKRLIPIEQVTKEITVKEAEELGMLRLHEKESNVFYGCDIIENKYSMTEDGGKVTVIGEYVVEKDIGTTVEIITD